MHAVALPTVLSAVVAGALFALAAFVGLKLGGLIPSPESEPDSEPRRFSPRAALLFAAVVGAGLELRGFNWEGIAIACVLTVFFSAYARDEIVRGHAHPALLLIPLTALFAAALIQLNWNMLLGGFGIFLIFGSAAYSTKGKGFGWDDAELAALGGAILGLEQALTAFAIACVAALCIARYRNRLKEPITFGPYLIATVGLGLILGF